MNRMPTSFVPGRQQAGAGLLEVLIAVLILGVGLLGIAAMQATALRNSQSSLERSQAVIQTYAILDAMRANIDVARIGGYNMPMTCDPPAGGTLATNDLAAWVNSLNTALGDGSCGQIQCGARSCAITVQWNDSRSTRDDAAAAELEEHQVTTRTRL